MLEKTEKKALIYLVGAIGSLTSLAISPQLTFDVTNPIKLVVLAFGGFASVAPLLIYRAFSNQEKFSIINLASFYFLIASVLIFFKSSLNHVTQFYGVHGRNTGLLAYVSLLLLFLSNVYSVTKENLNILIRIFIATGLISTLYGLLQIFNLDPLPWDKAGNWITSFYANPDFYSAFMGMFSGGIFICLFSQGIRRQNRILLGLIFCLNLFVLKGVGYYQGFVVLFIIILLSVFLLLLNQKLYKTSFIFLLLMISTSLLVVLDLLRLAPWRSFLYKPSITARGDYWRTAVEIFKNNPLFGVGFDGYRNYEGRYRDLTSTLNPEALNYTDGSHNVFLDFAVNGGILYFSAYILLLALTLRSVFRVSRRNSILDINFLLIFSCWIGYLAQSAVSFNHLGVAVWGWIFSGALIGYDLNQVRSETESLKPKSGRQVKVRIKLDKKFLLPATIAGTLGALSAIPVYLANAEMWQGIKKQNITIVEAAAYKWPRDVVRMSITAQMLNRVRKNQEALNLLYKAHEVDPQSVIPLKLIYDYLPGDDAKKNKVKAEIEKLDPYYFQIVARTKQ